MQEESEQDRTGKEEAAFDDVKGDSSLCHVRVTRPSTDLNRFLVDNSIRRQLLSETGSIRINRSVDIQAFCEMFSALHIRRSTIIGLLHLYNDTMSCWPDKQRDIKSHGKSKMDIVHLQNVKNLSFI